MGRDGWRWSEEGGREGGERAEKGRRGKGEKGKGGGGGGGGERMEGEGGREEKWQRGRRMGRAGPYLRGGGGGAFTPPCVILAPPLECSTSHDTTELPPGAPPLFCLYPNFAPPWRNFCIQPWLRGRSGEEGRGESEEKGGGGGSRKGRYSCRRS